AYRAARHGDWRGAGSETLRPKLMELQLDFGWSVAPGGGFLRRQALCYLQDRSPDRGSQAPDHIRGSYRRSADVTGWRDSVLPGTRPQARRNENRGAQSLVRQQACGGECPAALFVWVGLVRAFSGRRARP